MKVLLIFFSIIISLLCAWFIFLMLWGGAFSSISLREFYSDDSHYLEIQITYEESEYHILDYTEITPGFSYFDLSIEESNYDILIENNFFNEISSGEELQLTVSQSFDNPDNPEGYKIIEVRSTDKIYLEYQTGKENLINYYSNRIDKAYTILGGLLFGFLSPVWVGIILIVRKKPIQKKAKDTRSLAKRMEEMYQLPDYNE